MAFRDLREFIAELEKRGELKRIKAPVSPELEITEITDRVSKAYGPALLFENVPGYEMPVLMNAFGSYERMKLALGVERFDDIGEEFLSILNPEDIPVTMFEKLKMLPKLAKLSNFSPKIVKSGPVKEVIIKDNPDLNKLPVLKCWPQDGGRFITLPLVITKDPETGRRNVGMYRMQVYDGKTTGMHWHMHKDAAHFYQKAKRLGKPLEVAVALGGDPATIYAATAPLPPSIDEFLFAGFIRKEPVELVKAETVDLEVPAHAEIIIEGYVDPDELRLEGPFGDHTGYYSLTDYYPVFHVTAITHRKNPIYPATVVGKPPMEDCYMAKATERIFLPFLKLVLPEIVDLNLPLEGVFHNCAIVSIKKRYPGHARKVMNALWGLGQMMFTKMIIVVDEQVNVQNLSEVMWKVFNNIDAKRDLMIVEGPLDILDHASPLPNYGSKLGIDATKKWPSEGHTRPWPDDIEMDPEIKALVDRKWSDLGLD
ncbi:menaquinone biosynthesis decarboxylase [Carboxydothermus pertinax]|uniref:Menaquinone biosynthesis decarboxylase n=1 Tax=Carboxydothermus pertinax TaxID=870242 RepID=A0A1L8CX21_9THEO|nr:menaquinone biosynthesis decarboxylase [Carboxydothermus pertinax]GAV23443.1 menaquinone biosynthesis decarboxylase [Carboxydothermus pertinax]